ncbi:MAG: ThiF family adenylyltransferase [Pseudomonadales bacterium]
MDDTLHSGSKLSEHEVLRYSRHLQLPQVGATGQLRLKSAHAVVVGCGGLGAPVAQYLAAAGVGCLTLIDGDVVELSNLQRQVTFSEQDIGLPKSEQTQKRLQALNSDIDISAVSQHLNVDNAEALIASADIVLDCTDNFAARYLINDVCKLKQLPWAYASIHQFSGQMALFEAQGPCFRCLFPQPPANVQNCSAAGVLGVLPGILGTLQAAEALKYLLGMPLSLASKLMMVEVTDMLFQSFSLTQSDDCVSCAGLEHLNKHSEFYNAQCGQDSMSVSTTEIPAAQFLETAADDSNALLIDVRNPTEHAAFNLGGTNVPLDQLSDWLETKDRDQPLLFYCQIGARSNKACERATELGFSSKNLRGGINAYLADKL